MSKIKAFFSSPHIQIALASGTSIIVLAWVSKRVLAEPMDNLVLAFPPLIVALYESLLNKHGGKKFCTPWYWSTAVLAITALIIILYIL